MKGQARIEERSRCYCAVIVGTAVTVGSAAYAAKNQMDQAKAQEQSAQQASAALGKDPAATYGSKVEMPEYQDTVENPVAIYRKSLAGLKEVAANMNAFGISARNKLAGGGNLWSQNIQKQGQNIQSMMGGNLPKDLEDLINRNVAEATGGAFDPTAPGGYGGGLSQTGSGLARSLGQTSQDIMEKGMSYAPAWAKSVDDFTYKPSNAVSDLGVFQNTAQMQLQRDQARYDSQVNQAMAVAQPDPQVTGQVNDQLRLQGIEQTAEANRARAMQGLVTAGAQGAMGIYNHYNTPAVVAKPTGRQYIPGKGMVAQAPINRNGILT
jgi:hypothetical protein